jgi:hypothetical protein
VYPIYERHPRGSGPIGCGVTSLVVGILLTLLGCFWHFPPLTATTGVIVESRPLSAVASYHITYEYEAYGARHRGERVWRYASQFKSFYEVGSPFPVYFVTAHPEVSYGPNRPLSVRIIVMGTFFVVLAIGIMLLARPR